MSNPVSMLATTARLISPFADLHRVEISERGRIIENYKEKKEGGAHNKRRILKMIFYTNSKIHFLCKNLRAM